MPNIGGRDDYTGHPPPGQILEEMYFPTPPQSMILQILK